MELWAESSHVYLYNQFTMLMNLNAELLAACESAKALLFKLGGTNHDPEYSELCAAIAKAKGADTRAHLKNHLRDAQDSAG